IPAGRSPYLPPIVAAPVQQPLADLPPVDDPQLVAAPKQDVKCDAGAIPNEPKGFGYLKIPGISGTVPDAADETWIPIAGAGPAVWLPPKLGHKNLVPMDVQRITDNSTPALKAALNADVFPCAYVLIGPTKDFVFA